jgi:hypothetical protein
MQLDVYKLYSEFQTVLSDTRLIYWYLLDRGPLKTFHQNLQLLNKTNFFYV